MCSRRSPHIRDVVPRNDGHRDWENIRCPMQVEPICDAAKNACSSAWARVSVGGSDAQRRTTRTKHRVVTVLACL